MVTSSVPRFLADAAGLLCCIFGVMMALGGCLVPYAGAVMFWPGVVLILIGVLLSRSASRKSCPQCAEKVKAAAIKCRHCGHTFQTTSSSSLSEPFYK